MRLRDYALQLYISRGVSRAELCICKDNHSLESNRLPDLTYLHKTEVTDEMAFSFHFPSILPRVTRDDR